MRFVVYSAVLNGKDSVLGHLDRLVDRLADEVHLIDVPEMDQLQASSWYRKARATRKKVLLSAVAKPPRVGDARGPHAKAMEVRDAAAARVANRLAHAPLMILVEDLQSMV